MGYCSKCHTYVKDTPNYWGYVCDKCRLINMLFVPTIVVGLVILLLISSCSKKLLRQSPVLAVENRFYKFEKELGVISHNRCEKRKGKDRKCTKTFTDVMSMWDIFYPGHIIIKKDKVFK